MSKAITITVPNMEEAVKNCRTALDALGKNSGVALARAVNRSLEAVRTEATKIARSASNEDAGQAVRQHLRAPGR